MTLEAPRQHAVLNGVPRDHAEADSTPAATKGKRRCKPRGPRAVPGLVERLNEVVNAFGHVTKAASVIERSEGAVRKWCRGRSEPSASDIRRLCEASGYSAEWLLFGTDLQGRCERENRVLSGPARLKPS